MDLSIVIICKNEERFISKCIESVIEATNKIENKEILVVDSASTDRTIPIAKQYPVKIYQLRAEWRHTPAAGRYIGFLKSSGNYMLFLDGDSFLINGFIEKAIEYFEKNTEVAAIIGRRKEIYYRDNNIIGEERDINNIGEHPKFISIALASAIYRRAVLQSVGSFNPYLFAEEEAELSDRLKQAGYKIMGIPFDMVIHNTLPREKVRTLLQRMKSNLHLGTGQILRLGIQKRISAGLLKRECSILRFLVWVMIGFICGVLSLLAGGGIYFGGWMVFSILLFLAFIVKSRSIVKPIKYTIIWSLQSYSVIMGFLLKPMDPKNYPTDVIIIKQASNDYVKSQK